MTISSAEEADAATLLPGAARDPEGPRIRSVEGAPTLSPQLEAFILDRFSSRLEDPLTGRRMR